MQSICNVQVWSIGNEQIHCVQVHDMKDQVHNLVVANSISCFIPQGAGVKVIGSFHTSFSYLRHLKGKNGV